MLLRVSDLRPSSAPPGTYSSSEILSDGFASIRWNLLPALTCTPTGEGLARGREIAGLIGVLHAIDPAAVGTREADHAGGLVERDAEVERPDGLVHVGPEQQVAAGGDRHAGAQHTLVGHLQIVRDGVAVQ